MKIKDLLTNREKLQKYDELKEWKGAFGNENAKLQIKSDSNDAMKDLTWMMGIKLPDHIKQIIVNALEAEIAKLDEE